jgi:hypothetical protein
MAVRPEESLAKMIASLNEKTGKPLEEWQAIIVQKGLAKHGEVVSFLKNEHGVSHGYANQIALHRNDTAQESGSDEDPLDAIFANKELARAIYDDLIAKISAFGSDVDLAPKKAYVSVRRKKQFAILQPAANRLDVGINLPREATTARLEASGSFNAMLSHRVRVSSASEVDGELLGWLKKSYEGA